MFAKRLSVEQNKPKVIIVLKYPTLLIMNRQLLMFDNLVFLRDLFGEKKDTRIHVHMHKILHFVSNF